MDINSKAHSVPYVDMQGYWSNIPIYIIFLLYYLITPQSFICKQQSSDCYIFQNFFLFSRFRYSSRDQIAAFLCRLRFRCQGDSGHLPHQVFASRFSFFYFATYNTIGGPQFEQESCMCVYVSLSGMESKKLEVCNIQLYNVKKNNSNHNIQLDKKKTHSKSILFVKQLFLLKQHI